MVTDFGSFQSQVKMNRAEKEKYIENFEYPFCDDVNKYEKLSKIGQGTFGYVKNSIITAMI